MKYPKAVKIVALSLFLGVCVLSSQASSQSQLDPEHSLEHQIALAQSWEQAFKAIGHEVEVQVHDTPESINEFSRSNTAFAPQQIRVFRNVKNIKAIGPILLLDTPGYAGPQRVVIPAKNIKVIYSMH